MLGFHSNSAHTISQFQENLQRKKWINVKWILGTSQNSDDKVENMMEIWHLLVWCINVRKLWSDLLIVFVSSVTFQSHDSCASSLIHSFLCTLSQQISDIFHQCFMWIETDECQTHILIVVLSLGVSDAGVIFASLVVTVRFMSHFWFSLSWDNVGN